MANGWFKAVGAMREGPNPTPSTSASSLCDIYQLPLTGHFARRGRCTAHDTCHDDPYAHKFSGGQGSCIALLRLRTFKGCVCTREDGIEAGAFGMGGV